MTSTKEEKTSPDRKCLSIKFTLKRSSPTKDKQKVISQIYIHEIT